jgi:hypothetical protein
MSASQDTNAKPGLFCPLMTKSDIRVLVKGQLLLMRGGEARCWTFHSSVLLFDLVLSCMEHPPLQAL